MLSSEGLRGGRRRCKRKEKGDFAISLKVRISCSASIITCGVVAVGGSKKKGGKRNKGKTNRDEQRKPPDIRQSQG